MIGKGVFEDPAAQREREPEITEAPTRKPLTTIRLNEPHVIYGSPNYLIRVYHTATPTPADENLGWGDVVNAIVLSPDGSTRLLFSEHAYIDRIEYPKSDEDSLLKAIIVEAATHDTNGDKRINYEDERRVLVAPLSGAPLKSITPDSTYLIDATVISGGRELFIRTAHRASGKPALLPGGGRKIVYIYDVGSGQVRPAVDINDSIARAAHIVGE